MEERIVYHVKMGKPEAPTFDTNSDGVHILHEYDLVEGGRFVQGLEFLNRTHLLMSSGIYGGSFLELLKIVDTKKIETV